MTTPNIDPNAIPDEPIAEGTPAAQAQDFKPVWDSTPQHSKWEYVAELGGYIKDQDPDTLATSVGAIPKEFHPTYGYPPPHPLCRLGRCKCGREATA